MKYRCWMDTLNVVTRVLRGRPDIPFGGIQRVLFGDFSNYRPRLRTQAGVSRRKYGQKYLDNANACVLLRKKIRQTDKHFTDLLAKVRAGGTLDEKTKHELNKRVVRIDRKTKK